MSDRGPRGLRPDERELWNKIRKSASPLHKTNQEIVRETVEKMVPARPISGPDFQIGQHAPERIGHHSQATRGPVQLSRALVQMDGKKFAKLKRGKLSPEGRIDLHGMTLAQARPALVGYLLNAHSNGKRLVLIITGKGKQSVDEGPIPVRKGILKRHVPQWLKAAPLGPVVLHVSEAHQKHGGGGAYYVYLKRRV